MDFCSSRSWPIDVDVILLLFPKLRDRLVPLDSIISHLLSSASLSCPQLRKLINDEPFIGQ